MTSFRIAPRAFTLWVVEIDPDPDSIALTISQASGPRTSPTIVRPAVNRNESCRASFSVNSPDCRPSGPRSPEPGRDCHAYTILCRSGISCRPSSNSDSSVAIDSLGSNAPHKARAIVVFPNPCAPATTTDNLARTAAVRNDAANGDNA